MKVIKGTYPDGSPMHSALPTTRKDLIAIFSVKGIYAFPVKYLGKYDILYPRPKEEGGPVLFSTGVSNISDMTAKRWWEIADANCPAENRCASWTGLEGFFGWSNVNKLIEKETLS